MNRKIEVAKKKRAKRDADKAFKEQLSKNEVLSHEKLAGSIDNLYELINGKEAFDDRKLLDQLKEIDKRLDLSPHFKSLEKSLNKLTSKDSHKTNIIGFSELLTAVKDNKPLPSTVKLDKLEKTVVNIEQYIREQSKPDDTDASSFKPVRRVVKMGNRLIFDDIMTSSGGGGASSDKSFTRVEASC